MNKTEKLYYSDQYIKKFDATVLSSENKGDKFDVILDKSAFFPEEGGQYSDTGFIADAKVYEVYEENSVIHHITDKPLEIGNTVSCEIDFEERFEKMQCHTAEHILSGLIHKKYGYDNVGFHLGKEEVTMDISSPLSREELDEIEDMANRIVCMNIPVSVFYPDSDMASKLEYRSKLDIKDNLRIVKIGEYDSCACCAPHVNFTGEIGVIRIIEFAGLRGGIRIKISAGYRAFRQIKEITRSVDKISGLLSVPKSDVACEVEKRLKEKSELDYRYFEVRCELFTKTAREALSNGNNVVFLNDANAEEMRNVANALATQNSDILVLLSGTERDYKYNISSKTRNLRILAKDINSSLSGRGGGRENMITGSLKATLGEIEDFFK